MFHVKQKGEILNTVGFPPFCGWLFHFFLGMVMVIT